MAGGGRPRRRRFASGAPTAPTLADRFEERFVTQEGRRTLEESMDAGWEVLRVLPAGELMRLSAEQIARNIDVAAPDAAQSMAAPGSVS